jgi:hypothetical protein
LSSIEGDEFFIFDAKEIENIVRTYRSSEKKARKNNLPVWAKHSVHAKVWRIPLPKKNKSAEEKTGELFEKNAGLCEFILNHKKIKELRKESESVSKILTGIFSNDTVRETVPVKTMTASGNILALDAAHYLLFEALLEKEIWQKKEWEALAKKFNLLPDGAIETINEKAYCYFDEALFACDDDLYINIELLKKQKE